MWKPLVFLMDAQPYRYPTSMTDGVSGKLQTPPGTIPCSISNNEVIIESSRSQAE